MSPSRCFDTAAPLSITMMFFLEACKGLQGRAEEAAQLSREYNHFLYRKGISFV
jgi:hypothetical protein